MGGKASILMILGFNLIFMVVGYNYSKMLERAVDNEVYYIDRNVAHNIAVSGANLAANRIFLSKTWTTGYSNTPLFGGNFTVQVQTSGLNKIITSTGVFRTTTSVVRVELRPSYYSKFGNFYQTLTAYPATGDTFNGPFHVNSNLVTYGTPVFNGKATSKLGLSLQGSPKDPKFYGGYESGIDIPLDFDTTGMRQAATSNGKVFKDTTNTGKDINIELVFNSDATVTWRYSRNDGLNKWTAPKTESISTVAPNGLIFVEKGNIFVKGTLSGQVSIVSSAKGSTKSGFVYQTDDLQYKTDPRTDPASTDILGIIAENSIRLIKTPETQGQDIITQASMFSKNGDIGPEDALIDYPGFLGSWKILGGMIAKGLRVTARYGTVGGKTVPKNGYMLNHTYDKRFLTFVPPNFPNTRMYEIVSWLE